VQCRGSCMVSTEYSA